MSGSETQNYSVLSERELQIVELVASGLTNQDIAQALEISKRTVDNHVSNILQKTGTGNRVALLRWALHWGKICIDDVNCCRLPEFPPAIAPAVNSTVSPVALGLEASRPATVEGVQADKQSNSKSLEILG